MARGRRTLPHAPRFFTFSWQKKVETVGQACSVNFSFVCKPARGKLSDSARPRNAQRHQPRRCIMPHPAPGCERNSHKGGTEKGTSSPGSSHAAPHVLQKMSSGRGSADAPPSPRLREELALGKASVQWLRCRGAPANRAEPASGLAQHTPSHAFCTVQPVFL